MVLKQYKTFNSGNTIRAKPRKKTGNDYFTVSGNNGVENEGTNERFETYLPYSTNKRNHWRLKDQWSTQIPQVDSDTPMTLKEQMLWKSKADCTTFISNCTTISKRTPKKKYMNGNSVFQQHRRQLTAEQEDNDNTIPRQVGATNVTFYKATPKTSTLREPNYGKKHGVQRKKWASNYSLEELEFQYDDIDSIENEMIAEAIENSLTEPNIPNESLFEVYVQPPKTSQRDRKRRFQSNKKTYNHQNTKSILEEMCSSDTENESVQVTVIDLKDCVQLESCLVYLMREEITPDALKLKFDYSYEESENIPRQFGIDMTTEVASLLKSCTPVTNLAMLLVQEVETSDWCLVDKPEDTGAAASAIDWTLCRVTLNLCLKNEGVSKIECIQVRHKYSVESLLNLIRETVIGLTKDSFDLEHCQKIHVMELTTSNEKCALGNTILIPTSHFSLEVVATSTESETKFPKKIFSTEENMLCGICFEAFDEKEDLDSEDIQVIDRLQIRQCGHTFCRDCWRQHLIMTIKKASKHFICPSSKCGVNLDKVTCLSFVSLRLYAVHIAALINLHHQDTTDSNRETQLIWCPRKLCGRVYRLDVSQQGSAQKKCSIRCGCHKPFCSSCLGPAHWPAPCEVAHSYFKELTAQGDLLCPGLSNIENSITIKGKNCPSCHAFIDKNGGCNHMVCVCGVSFCWHCGIDMKNHTHSGVCSSNKATKKSEKQLVKQTFTDEMVYYKKSTEQSSQYYKSAVEMRKQRLWTTEDKKQRNKYCDNISKKLRRLSKLDSLSTPSDYKREALFDKEADEIMDAIYELRCALEYINASAWYLSSMDYQSKSFKQISDFSGRISLLHDRIMSILNSFTGASYSVNWRHSDSKVDEIYSILCTASNTIKITGRTIAKLYGTSESHL